MFKNIHKKFSAFACIKILKRDSLFIIGTNPTGILIKPAFLMFHLIRVTNPMVCQMKVKGFLA